MTTDGERQARAMARSILGAGVGYCHDVGYSRDHVLAYAMELYDQVHKVKQEIGGGKTMGEVFARVLDEQKLELSPSAKRILGID